MQRKLITCTKYDVNDSIGWIVSKVDGASDWPLPHSKCNFLFEISRVKTSSLEGLLVHKCYKSQTVWSVKKRKYRIIIIIYPLRHEAHRSRTKVLHFSLFLANFSSSFQDFPIALSSCSLDLYQVVLGLRLFLFPKGFHLSAYLLVYAVSDRSNPICGTALAPPVFLALCFPTIPRFWLCRTTWC